MEGENKRGNPNILQLNYAKRYYKNPEELAAKVEAYWIWIQGEKEIVREEFQDADRKIEDERLAWVREPEPATVLGLSLFLGFATEQSLYDYAKKGPVWAYIMKRAFSIVKYHYEKKLNSDKPTGAIFALKNMGGLFSEKVLAWEKEADKSEVDWNALPMDLQVRILEEMEKKKLELSQLDESTLDEYQQESTGEAGL